MWLDQFSVFAKPVFPYGQPRAAGGMTDLKNTAATADKACDNADDNESARAPVLRRKLRRERCRTPLRANGTARLS